MLNKTTRVLGQTHKQCECFFLFFSFCIDKTLFFARPLYRGIKKGTKYNINKMNLTLSSSPLINGGPNIVNGKRTRQNMLMAIKKSST